MARKRKTCGGCLLKLLITLLIVAVIVFTAGFFGGNALFKKYIGDEGELAPMGINNWGEFITLANGFKGKEPEIDQKNKVTQETTDATEDELNRALENVPKKPDGSIDYGKLSESGFALRSDLYLSGGMIAVVLDGALNVSGLSIPVRVEGVALTVDGGVGAYRVTISIDKKSVIDLLPSGAMKNVINFFIGGSLMYLALDFSMETDESGRIEPIGVESGSQPAITVNNLNAEKSATVVGAIATVAGQTDARGFARLLANEMIGAVNGLAESSRDRIEHIASHEFGGATGTKDALVVRAGSV